MRVKVNIDFENIVANNIMVPRHRVEIGYNNGDIVEDYINAFNGKCGNLTHTYIPVMDYYYQEIVGYVIKDEIMDKSINIEDKIQLHTHKILKYSDGILIDDIFKDMINKNENIAVIYNNETTFAGIVTMSDIIKHIKNISC